MRLKTHPQARLTPCFREPRRLFDGQVQGRLPAERRMYDPRTERDARDAAVAAKRGDLPEGLQVCVSDRLLWDVHATLEDVVAKRDEEISENHLVTPANFG